MTLLQDLSERAGEPQKRWLPDGGGLMANTLKVLLSVYCVSLLIGWMATRHLALEGHVVMLAAAILAVMFLFVLMGLPRHRHARFGYGNAVTAIRAGLVSLVAATILSSQSFAEGEVTVLIWSMVAATCLALALDGVDGSLARLFRQQSELGARFDMEVDAFLILMLSIACFVLDKAGAWVMAIGMMRYAFVAAQWLFPALRAELFASVRRKLVCVIQVAALCLAVVPGLAQPFTGALCAICLLLLAYSFAVDTAWLITRSRRAAR
ncbi:CDP-alcohol phosphatidyltransferase family protein [Rhizobium sp. SSA_523]|uniref:CDP-alcohol phosphatidyltransferase family protein n=1 Tax=Rhizobium sp. SSA_523 TaxID=2952477 RepID=UPI00209025C0|nr:CDP-alcohol phosphatidyltransferase family protein [Rhizobium sp. SSA_523]MCO5732480.1 CDP-alcohol phosphatidyltransferase family protein [Rhizobium sp. SSA_523]WKC22379.1 CDP-alcohol phosphatidyltransferase family protein [Rhizobium sp. SSA_523]